MVGYDGIRRTHREQGDAKGLIATAVGCACAIGMAGASAAQERQMDKGVESPLAQSTSRRGGTTPHHLKIVRVRSERHDVEAVGRCRAVHVRPPH